MMTIRTSVMLLAAAAMPLSLQAKPAKTTAPAAATATAQKAGALAAMALLPADADDFVALSLTPEVAACLGASAESAAQLDGVALANGKGSAAAFSSFLPLVRAASALQTVEDKLKPAVSFTFDDEEEAGDPDLKPGNKMMPEPKDTPVQKAARQAKQQLETAMLKALQESKGAKLPTLYVAATVKPAGQQSVDEMLGNYLSDEGLQGLVAQLGGEGSPVKAEVAKSGDLKGLKLTLVTPPTQELAVFMGRTVYVLAKKQGNAVLLALCEDPADISLPTSEATSLASTLKDKKIGSGFFLRSSFTPQMTQALLDTYKAVVQGVRDGEAAVIAEQKKQDPSKASALDQKLSAMDDGMTEFFKLFPAKVTKPTALQVKESKKGWNVQVSFDADGATFTTVTGAMAPGKTKPVFFAQKSLLKTTAPQPDWQKMVQSAATAASSSGDVLTAMVGQCCSRASTFLMLWDSMGSDKQASTLLLTEDSGALFAGLNDQAAFTEAWKKLISGEGSPIADRVKDNGDGSYTIAGGEDSPITVSIKDGQVVAGTPDVLQAVKPDPKATVSGIKFRINIPLSAKAMMGDKVPFSKIQGSVQTKDGCYKVNINLNK